jgi:Zn-finger in ubiquitin-hydrolases and other protein
VCEQCLALGDSWPALRMCLTCGHVGCCEKTRNQHALKQFQAHRPSLGQALKERGMNWVWCYLDKTLLASTAT